MSIKIYNGYIINKKMNVSELFEFQERVRTQVRKELDEVYSKTFAHSLFNMFDGICLCENALEYVSKNKDIKIKDLPFSDIYWRIYEEFKKSINTNQRSMLYDFGFSVTFHYLKSSSKILCLLFTEESKFRKIWESQPEVQEYHYQNQSDKPDEIPTRVWGQRKRDWEKAIGFGIPCMHGLILDAVTDTTLPNPYMDEIRAKIISYIPDVSIRTQKRAKDIVIDRVYKEKMRGKEERFDIDIFTETRKEVESGKFEEEIASEIEKIKLIDIGEDNIFKSIEEIIAIRDGVEIVKGE